jgi:hypothetical protein
MHDNTQAILDIVSTHPALLMQGSLRATCGRLWGVWLGSYMGECKHYEYIASMMSSPVISRHRRVSIAKMLAIPPTFTWGRVVLPRVETEYNTRYKYILNVARDRPLFTFNVLIMLKYHFEDVSFRYYTYTLSKVDHINSIVIRRASSVSSLSFDIGDVFHLNDMYNLAIVTAVQQHNYRINDRINLCMHDSGTYPITMAETRRLTSFMQSSALDFLDHLPSRLIEKKR